MARILVIDDEDLIRAMIRRVLERAGHEVVEAIDGADGVRRFRSSPADLVVCDVIMPEKDGIETIIELLKFAPKLKIIAMSGGGQISHDKYLKMARVLGAAASLNKPFHQREFMEAVDNALAA